MRGGAHGGRRGQLQATEPNRAWNEPQSAQLWFSWLETQSIRLVPMAGANSERVTEQRGKAHPCHASASVATDSSNLQGVSMGGTGLEPVTPSLSSPQDATPAFAPARAFRRLCRSFRAPQHRAFPRVGDLWRLLVLAPVSTGRTVGGLPRTSEQLVLRELPDLELPLRFRSPTRARSLSASERRSGARRSPRAPDTARAAVSTLSTSLSASSMTQMAWSRVHSAAGWTDINDHVPLQSDSGVLITVPARHGARARTCSSTRKRPEGRLRWVAP